LVSFLFQIRFDLFTVSFQTAAARKQEGATKILVIL